ncbi:MAG TPA: redoxin family protein [Trebonia sp.]|jgi:thiol-disulfide isomerase/thioredoxin|nr:redoxin family protein [Trebonia sp.]
MSGPLHLPALDGAAGWLNSPPLQAASLRGHVTVVNFWTLTCINWLRQEPYVRAWSRAYRDDGLVVIGVHTPEFFFEHDVDLVRQATGEREIDYPVAIDNRYAIWNAFDNHYWPALYFVDSDGVIVGQHFGEGQYEQSERVIQRALGSDRPPVAPAVTGRGVEAAADWDHLRSPETYLGDGRSEGFSSPEGVVPESRLYRIPSRLELNHWALAGHWTVEQEKASLDHAGGRIAFRFQARDANLVMSAGGGEPVPFRVLVDGQAPGASHGADTDASGNGVLSSGRLYQLVREQGSVLERTLEITFDGPGAQAYVFTFG